MTGTTAAVVLALPGAWMAFAMIRLSLYHLHTLIILRRACDGVIQEAERECRRAIAEGQQHDDQ